MVGKRSWIDDAADEILAIGNSASAGVKSALRHSGLPTPGNIARGKQIADEVYKKWADAAGGAKNAGDNRYDAGRHAEWQYRTTKELGSSFARMVGDMHEVPAQVWERVQSLNPKFREEEALHRYYAHKMDYYNNDVARRSAMNGVPYDEHDLQLSPISVPMRPRGAAGFYAQPENLPGPARRALSPVHPVTLQPRMKW